MAKYEIGSPSSDMLYTEPHEVPPLQEGDELHVYGRSDSEGRAEPYRSKLTINHSRVSVIGHLGPNGEMPVFDAAGAVEQSGVGYQTPQVRNAGLISVCPPYAGGPCPQDVHIHGIEVTGAHPANIGYTSQFGEPFGWFDSTAGIYLGECQRVAITGCKISACGNGVFGKSNGVAGRDLRDIYLGGNWITGNGVKGSPHQHGTYIEGIRTCYEFNHYDGVLDWSQALQLKDRGAGTVVLCNRFTGMSLRPIDLVEPADGAPTFWLESEAGKAYVAGNTILLPLWTPGASFIHFGTDGDGPRAQERLYMMHNTLIAVNRAVAGGRNRTAVFKLGGAQAIEMFGNICHILSDDPEHWCGDLVLAVSEYGDGSEIRCGTNWFPEEGFDFGAATVHDWEQNWVGSDPGLVDALGGDYALAPGSICSHLTFDPTWGQGGVYVPIPAELAPYLPRQAWVGDDWQRRDGWLDLGACGQ